MKPSELRSVREAAGDVVVVDEVLDTLALYASLLAEDGHRVRTAASLEHASELVLQREPELVLVDLGSPPGANLDLVRRLRGRRGGGPAILLVTPARRDPEFIERALREGVDACLTKPIDARELLVRTRAALESFRLRRLLADQRRDQVAMLVHDLRHPLSSLSLLGEVLEADDLPAGERAAAVHTLRSLCAELNRLIDSVLAASRLEAGAFSVEAKPTTVGEFLAPTLATFAPVAARRNITLVSEGDGNVPITCDSPKLRQAVDNVVANALKFTPRGGRVTLRTSRVSPVTTLEISDTGPGIPEAERHAIFDRYVQGRHGRAAGGAGLGLAIARWIAEAHQGTVEIVSQNPEASGAGPLANDSFPEKVTGATFRITIPDRLAVSKEA